MKKKTTTTNNWWNGNSSIYIILGIIIGCSTSCSNLSGFGASGQFIQTGGDVPRTIQFQRYKFRTGAAFKAQLGAIGIKRTAGSNVFELKRIPKLQSIGLHKSAIFTKTTSGSYQLAADVNFSELAGYPVAAAGSLDGSLDGNSKQTGVYTIYYLSDLAGLVKQLNSKENEDIRNYLRRTRDARIITAVVKVKDHHFVSTKNGKINLKAIDTANTESKAELNTVKNDGSNTGTKITEKNQPGLSIANGGTYAYEYARILWAQNDPSGQIIDILVDRPLKWYTFGDINDHHLDNVVTDPRKIKNS